MEGKIILNLAMSLDGCIVDEFGKYDWIKGDGSNHLDSKEEFSYNEFLKSIDVIVMGRVSYDEFIQSEGFENKQIIVATTQKRNNFDQTVFVNDNLIEYVQTLKEAGKKIWLFGGSVLTDSFIKKNAVDEYIVGIIPIILGNGKKLFLNDNPKIQLKLHRYSFKEGVGILEYRKP